MPDSYAGWIGLGQLLFAFLLWLGIRPKHLGKWTMLLLARDRIIATMFLGGLAFSCYGLYRTYQHPAIQLSNEKYAISDYRKWQSDKQTTVSGKSFANETVDVDGKIFDRCTFQNVTFIYHGTGAVTFLESKFLRPGQFFLLTDNAAAKGFGFLMNFFIQINPDQLFIGEKDGITGQIRKWTERDYGIKHLPKDEK